MQDNVLKKAQRVLLIEDNLAIARQISDFLSRLGWIIDFADKGEQGIQVAKAHPFDVILLDLNLPDIDGLKVCDRIKSEATWYAPILMLTARDTFDDKARGFGQGADDYLTKPFDLRELALRCNALTRRTQLHSAHELAKGGLTIDNRATSAFWHNEMLTLTGTGLSILSKLLEAYPYPVARSDLIYHLWGDEPPESNALKSHIYSLRRTLEQASGKRLLETISGVGYCLKHLED